MGVRGERSRMINSPLEQFEVVQLVGIRLGWADVSFTNASVMLLISGAVILGLMSMVGEKGGKVVPGRWQGVLEGMYKLVVGMVYESIGKEGGKYFVLVFTQFMLILVLNVLGLIPYSYTVTSHLVVTMVLSMGVWVGKLIVGVKKHGWKLFGILLPGGTPFAMIPFFVLVEAIGFVIPMISLAVRLFANLMSGHILLKVLFGFAWTMMMAGGILYVGHFIPLGILFLLYGLETAVALIQAYVFALLTCIYIGDMESGGH